MINMKQYDSDVERVKIVFQKLDRRRIQDKRSLMISCLFDLSLSFCVFFFDLLIFF